VGSGLLRPTERAAFSEGGEAGLVVGDIREHRGSEMVAPVAKPRDADHHLVVPAGHLTEERWHTYDEQVVLQRGLLRLQSLDTASRDSGNSL
jgi:hypothetical protein